MVSRGLVLPVRMRTLFVRFRTGFLFSHFHFILFISYLYVWHTFCNKKDREDVKMRYQVL